MAVAAPDQSGDQSDVHVRPSTMRCGIADSQEPHARWGKQPATRPCSRMRSCMTCLIRIAGTLCCCPYPYTSCISSLLGTSVCRLRPSPPAPHRCLPGAPHGMQLCPLTYPDHRDRSDAARVCAPSGLSQKLCTLWSCTCANKQTAQSQNIGLSLVAQQPDCSETCTPGTACWAPNCLHRGAESAQACVKPLSVGQPAGM